MSGVFGGRFRERPNALSAGGTFSTVSAQEIQKSASSGCLRGKRGIQAVEIQEEVMAKDPVCNMEVKESESKFKSQHGGKTYSFCSEECKETFEEKPEQYAAGAA
ncbi:MAG: YHS domain-containing protein [Acidobacteriales bacterium]|nr:YHS domain-containing protein [Terriglobales bacterium]